MQNKSSISGIGRRNISHSTAARSFLGSTLRTLFSDPSREHKQTSTVQESAASVLLADTHSNTPAP